jgi:uncharacterized protein YndB with AHSA1/START domain
MAAANNLIPDSAAPAIVNTRVFPVPPARLFEAFGDPAQLARWWGPAGFTNTIQEFDFRPGGAWRITMRGPDGAEYPNESRFLEVTPPAHVVFEHLGPLHRYWMTMEFAPAAGGTRLTWRMRFESAAEHARLKDFIAAANEQNFDRLEAALAESARPVR